MESLYYGKYASQIIEKNSDFKLHFHDSYEIFLFLGGDAEYIVEGNKYPLKKNDLILINPGEMHRINHKSHVEYTRINFNIDHEFFEKNNCIEYLNIFKNREIGTNNKIEAEIIIESGLLSAIHRWREYTDNGDKYDSAIGICALVEILHILNTIDTLSPKESGKNLIGRVIFYINKNYTRKLSLEELEEKFYVSRHHLCRIFKESTGYTISAYINSKRFAKTQELYSLGMSIGDACIEAGFSNYSTFYKAFVKEFHCSPKVKL